MYQVDIIFDDLSISPSPEELSLIITNALKERDHSPLHVSSSWVNRRAIFALKDGKPEEQTHMSEREAQGFSHNYPGMHLFFADAT